MSMTQADYVEAMPFLATWEPPELLPRFVAAMDKLQSMIYGKPTLDGLIGVIILEPEEESDVRVISKAKCAKQGQRAGLDPETIEAIRSPNHPGTMDLLILAKRYQVVIGMPATLEKIPRPGSQNN